MHILRKFNSGSQRLWYCITPRYLERWYKQTSVCNVHFLLGSPDLLQTSDLSLEQYGQNRTASAVKKTQSINYAFDHYRVALLARKRTNRFTFRRQTSIQVFIGRFYWCQHLHTATVEILPRQISFRYASKRSLVTLAPIFPSTASPPVPRFRYIGKVLVFSKFLKN